MYKYLPLRLLIISTVIFSQTYFAYSQTLESFPEREEYTVYNCLFEQMFIGEYTEQLVIEGFTEADNLYKDYPKIRKKLASRFKDTAADYLAKNERSYELKNNFNVKVKINLLRANERKELFDKLNANYFEWDRVFGEKYSKSGNQIISISRVGFNADKTKAMILVGYQCGWTCGEGNYFLLAKKEGKWKIKKKFITWIS